MVLTALQNNPNELFENKICGCS